MAISLSPPFPSYFGRDGKPLENGQVYFGTVNLDPQNNPVAVYWDSALSVSAVQPVRTAGGFPVYNGAPGRLYTAANCSTRVLDKNGGFVYESPTITDLASIAAVTIVVSTIAAMTALPKTGLADGATATVLGYNAARDGGGGMFQWVAASTATADGGLTFAADEGGTGRWLRVYEPPLNVLWWGILDDGTDQTTELLALWTTLGVNFADIVTIPYGVKFNADQVYDAMPLKAILYDNSAVNAYDTAGFRQRTVGIAERGDPTSIVDLQQILSSGHNACFVLDNRGTAGSSSAALGIAMVMWSRGKLSNSPSREAIRQLGRNEWSKIPGQDKWWWIMRRFVPWAANGWEYWYSGEVFAAGSYCVNSAGTYVYYTAAGGTTGNTDPTHTSGTVSDGGVLWTYIAPVDDGIFAVNENGEMATNTAPVAGQVATFKASAQSTGTASMFLEATGISKTADLRLRPTNAGGTVPAIPYMQAQDGVGLRVIASTGGRTFITYTDAEATFDNSRFAEAFAVDIANIAATINTADKFDGKVIRDKTNYRLMIARGSTAGSVWDICDGSGSVTPV